MVPTLTLQYLAVTSPLVPEINKWQLVPPGQAGSWLEPPSSALLLHLVFLTFQHNQRARTWLSVSKQYPHPAVGLVEEQSWVQPTPELQGHTEDAGGGQLGVFQALDPVPAIGGRCGDPVLAGLHGIGSQQLPGEAQGCSPAPQQSAHLCQPGWTVPSLPWHLRGSGRTGCTFLSLNSLNASSRSVTPEKSAFLPDARVGSQVGYDLCGRAELESEAAQSCSLLSQLYPHPDLSSCPVP